ncbi:MAG: CPBP family intramembrane metalloprotease [Desulfobacteraceae bacterium]|nr:MAG: CPBP family intramembrane metalloprotease [Desulfobacteraceae bacterium]
MGIAMGVSPDKNHDDQPNSTGGMADVDLNPAVLPGRPKQGGTGNLPERYAIKTNGNERVLTCLEAPNLNVHIEAGMAFSGSVARKSPPGTIFLDGVAQCEPFMDHERQVYNLDHHEGCVRSFTLAACEQALVMYMKGLDLQSREWNIFANEPDLDTLLSIWIILNHARIGRQDVNQRRLLFALVRYEGIIDALGLELKELSAFPAELMRKIQRVIDHLRSEEVALKKQGVWGKTDFLGYAAAILHKIDQIFYKPSDFADYLGVEELARVDLTDQRIAAVVEADMGIYEIEPHLNKLYGSRLGVVFLKKGLRTYTVRQMDLFMPITLEDIYDRLNFVDPAVKNRTLGHKWGGAADIGGSPRETGTQLQPLEIVHACRQAIRKPDWGQKTYRLALTTVLVGFIVLCAHIVRLIWDPAKWLAIETPAAFWTSPDFGFMLTLLTASAISLVLIARSHPWQYGWLSPIGKQWWLLLPAALVGGIAGGLWAPESLVEKQSLGSLLVIGVLGLPLAAEMLFRSLAHGLLAQDARTQRYDSRWFIAWPVIGSTLLYTAFVMALFLSNQAGNVYTPLDWGKTALTLSGALLLGLAAGMVRERSQSLWTAVVFHMLAAAAAFLAHYLLQ